MGAFEELVPGGQDRALDEQREVSFAEFADDLVVLPDHSTDDTDAGWGEPRTGNEDRLLAERPPHWA